MEKQNTLIVYPRLPGLKSGEGGPFGASGGRRAQESDIQGSGSFLTSMNPKP